MMRPNPFIFGAGVVSAVLLSNIHLFAADWPNWRGPSHNGVSTETGWQAEWPAEGPKQLWKATIGTGFSSISVSNGRVYTSGNSKNVDTIFCFDAQTGNEIWKYSYDCPLDPKMYEGGPSATPTIDGNSVYTVSKKGLVLCLAADTGKLLWSTNVTDTNGLAMKIPGWGFASSAHIDGNLAIFNIGTAGIAFEKKTGAVVWKSGDAANGYSTPVPCSFGGKKAVSFMTSSGAVAVDPQSGAELWQFPWKTAHDLSIADPIISGDKVLLSAGYDHGATLIQIKEGKPEKVWDAKKFRNHFNTSTLVDGYVYGFDGGAGDDAKFTCIDFNTGEVKWAQDGLGSGSLMLADKKMIILSSKGELVTATPSPEGFKPISRAQVLDGKCWTMPVLANGKIYCRGAAGLLVCLDVKGK